MNEFVPVGFWGIVVRQICPSLEQPSCSSSAFLLHPAQISNHSTGNMKSAFKISWTILIKSSKLPVCLLSRPARQRWSGTCPAGTSDSCSPAPAPWSAPPTPRHLSPRSPSWKKNIWNLCRLGGEYHQTCCLFRPRQTGSDMSRYFGKSTDIS